MRIPPGFRFMMKYITPAYLLIVFGGFAYQKLNPYDPKSYIGMIADNVVVQYSLWLLASVAAGLFLATLFGERRWLKMPARGPSGQRRLSGDASAPLSKCAGVTLYAD